ncbi:DUF481 domain-containing protein [Sphingomonas sp. SUN019]|uniref:DUF481 domain-containing protein n=1 Tax=Sphingomonas sp. SUN019 TaxID=2937788 RepID=UPI0021643204|nr:DUF481 domain-containing protein [Sphingomonas sp. SUN019]UVO49121.1 DUF481 domain-containing protein [Sphingomonas sp. SUN019]
MRRLLLLFAPMLLANGALTSDPPEIPAPIRAMLDAAIASGNEGDVATVVKLARSADPASGDAVAAVAATWLATRAKERDSTIRQAGAFDLWRGRAELGGYMSTGNTDTSGATAVIDLTREGLNWRHKLRAQGDYQRNAGITNREYLLVAYEPNLKVDDRRYVYGAAQFETDRFFGYTQRYSASAGAGYSAIKSPAVTLNLELGPAYRYTHFTDDNVESSLAARGSVDFDWKLSPGLTLRQDASAYVQRFNSTISSTSALAARVIGPLSAQFSYTVQYESEPPIGRVSTDTVSRASLVYTF